MIIITISIIIYIIQAFKKWKVLTVLIILTALVESDEENYTAEQPIGSSFLAGIFSTRDKINFYQTYDQTNSYQTYDQTNSYQTCYT
jgi:hypothetical protein